MLNLWRKYFSFGTKQRGVAMELTGNRMVLLQQQDKCFWKTHLISRDFYSETKLDNAVHLTKLFVLKRFITAGIKFLFAATLVTYCNASLKRASQFTVHERSSSKFYVSLQESLLLWFTAWQMNHNRLLEQIKKKKTFNNILFCLQERHVPICEKSASKKRKVFDSAKMRAEGTEISSVKKTTAPSRRAPQKVATAALWTKETPLFCWWSLFSVSLPPWSLSLHKIEILKFLSS